MVDGETENEHVTSGQTDDWVGETRKGSIIIVTCVSPYSGSGAEELDRFWG